VGESSFIVPDILLDASTAINLEKSLRLSDRLGGHLVSGHVDGVGTVTAVKPVDASREILVRFPAELGRYIARKGSIAINGISLTVNVVTADTFSVNLIPHTLAVTNLKYLKQGDRVNLEIDLVARYVERMFDRHDQRWLSLGRVRVASVEYQAPLLRVGTASIWHNAHFSGAR